MQNEKPVASTGARLGVAILGILGALLIYLLAETGQQMFKTFLPSNGPSFAGLESTLASMNTLSMLILILFSPLLGLAADWIGRRIVIVIGALLAAVGLLVSGLANSVPVLWAAQIILAIGAAMLAPAILSFLVTAFTQRDLAGTAASMFIITATAAGSLGVVFFGNTTDTLGLHSSFLIAAGLLLAAVLLGSFLLLGSYLLSRRWRWPAEWLDGNRSAFGFLEALILLLIFFLVSFTLNRIQSHVLLLARETQGVPIRQISLYISIAAMSAGLVALFAGPLADVSDWLTRRYLRRSVGYAAFLLLGSLLVVFGMALLSFGRPRIVMFAAVLVGLGQGLFYPAFYAVLFSTAHSRWWSTVAGMAISINLLGAAANNMLVSGATRLAVGSSLALAYVTILLAMILTLVLILMRVKAKQASEARVALSIS